jgi:hypothetical protein
MAMAIYIHVNYGKLTIKRFLLEDYAKKIWRKEKKILPHVNFKYYKIL